ncbi:hypothetical protein BBBOND_0203370 [Babesia bigemina]|uniref:Uncharacterized protein n=1 Tax=Babesia bigemina TaxID=5866 RepID=A0A061DBQ3_BABBI|nr:hypothetical protein BBBOND_0203370 [Babesia bigemina]CDR95180.1 hypothetical protein BBBOND_0203370 [Babesia bigemina]|eukprot:XP_012767366.1 hypothetical protein BBBOND_0203370 [Babesia bigemina]
MSLLTRFSGLIGAGIKAAQKTFASAAKRGIESLTDSAFDGAIDASSIKSALESPGVEQLMDSVIQMVMWHVWISYVIPMMLIMGFLFGLLFAAYFYGWLNRCSAGFLRCITLFIEMIMYAYWRLKKALRAFWGAYTEFDDYGLLSKFRGHRYLPAKFAKCKLR